MNPNGGADFRRGMEECPSAGLEKLYSCLSGKVALN